MESIILATYVIAAAISAAVAILFFQLKLKKQTELYCYLDDQKWRDIPSNVANQFGLMLESLFSFDKGNLQVVLRSAAFSFLVSMFILLVWRASVAGGISGWSVPSLWVLFLVWAVSSALVGPASVFITYYFVRKIAQTSVTRKIADFISLELLFTYLLVSLSIYSCLIFTAPAISWFKDSIYDAISVISILLSFAHENALTWPTHGVISVDGLSAVVVSIATLIPSLVFIISICIALLTLIIFRIISHPILKALNWFSEQTTASLAVNTSCLAAAFTCISAIGKIFELL